MKRALLAIPLLVFELFLYAAAAETNPSPFLQQVGQHFTRWDLDKNGALDTAEIDHAISNNEFKGEAAAAAVALKRAWKGKTGRFNFDAIREEVEKHRNESNRKTGYEAFYDWALARIRGAARVLFVSQPPQIDSIRQGKLGDCFCLAALRSILQRDPEAIVKMIQPKSDGTHVVQLGAQFISVSPLTDGEIALGASSADGLWPLIYEKAVGLSRIKPDAEDATPLNVVTKGGSAGSMMSFLTQHEIKRWSCKTWRDASENAEKQASLLDDLRDQLKSAQRENRLVTGGTGSLPGGKKGVPGILYNHGYSILGYEESTDQLHLWNPHGESFQPKGPAGIENGYPMSKGEFRVPLTELVKFFGGFAFEQATSSGLNSVARK